jgi:hypothetical protein
MDRSKSVKLIRFSFVESLAGRYISRLKDDLVRTKQHYQALSDLLLDTPCVTPTGDIIKTEKKNSNDGDLKVKGSGTAIIGDQYHYYRNGAEMDNEKVRYAKIHETVMNLACRICGCSFDFLSARLMAYERAMVRETTDS